RPGARARGDGPLARLRHPPAPSAAQGGRLFSLRGGAARAQGARDARMRLDGFKASGFDEAFDYVIVGSGAAGATAARVLADTGRSVAVLEEGPAVEPKDFVNELFPSFQKMFRDQGGQVARGRAFIPVIQGRCLGGSTVVNSAIVWRLPEDV